MINLHISLKLSRRGIKVSLDVLKLLEICAQTTERMIGPIKLTPGTEEKTAVIGSRELIIRLHCSSVSAPSIPTSNQYHVQNCVLSVFFTK